MEVRPQGDSFRAPRHHRVLGEVGSQCAGASAVFSATRCCSHTSLNARRTCLMHGSASVGRRSSSTRGDRVPHTGDDNDDPGGHNEALTDPARGTDGRAGKDGLQYIGATGFPALPPVQAGLERGRQDHAPSAPASMTQLDGPPVGVCTGLRRRRRRRQRGPDGRPEARREDRGLCLSCEKPFDRDLRRCACGGTTIHPDFKEALKKYNF